MRGEAVGADLALGCGDLAEEEEEREEDWRWRGAGRAACANRQP